MKNKYLNAFLLFAMAIVFQNCSRIDAGHTGIRVNLYGSNKGVDDVTEVTGRVWYNPITTNIYKWPTFVQNSVYTKDEREGSETNQELRVTTKDGLVVSFDISMNWRVDPRKVTSIFTKYRKDLPQLSESVIRNYSRKGFNSAASEYTAEELYERRSNFQSSAADSIRKILEPEGFIIEHIVLLNELRLPESVVDNITLKINARQMALRKQEEVEQAKADAEKERQKAKGKADARMIEAEAEAEANKIISTSLSKTLVEYYQVQKWSGTVPKVVSSGSGLILDLK